MAIIKGNAVANATTYELYEVTGGGFTLSVFINYVAEFCDLLINGEKVTLQDGGRDVVYEDVNTFEVVSHEDWRNIVVSLPGDDISNDEYTYGTLGNEGDSTGVISLKDDLAITIWEK